MTSKKVCSKCGVEMEKVWRYPSAPVSSHGVPITPFHTTQRMGSEQFGSVRDALDEVADDIRREKAHRCPQCGRVEIE